MIAKIINLLAKMVSLKIRTKEIYLNVHVI